MYLLLKTKNDSVDTKEKKSSKCELSELQKRCEAKSKSEQKKKVSEQSSSTFQSASLEKRFIRTC